MAKANLTCTTSWTSSMLLAGTSPRRPPSNTVKLTMLRRNSASSMRLYPLSNKQSRSQNTLETTMTTLSCANCTTKMRMDSSPTLPSWTNCAASKLLMRNQSTTKKKRPDDYFIEELHFKQLKICVITSTL